MFAAQSAFTAYRAAGITKPTSKKQNISKQLKAKNHNANKLKQVVQNTPVKKKDSVDKNEIIDSVIEVCLSSFNHKLSKNQKKSNKSEKIIPEDKPRIKKLSTEKKISENEAEPPQQQIYKYTDSVALGKSTFQWVLNSCDVDYFFQNIWEKTFKYIQNDNPSYFSTLISMNKIDEILRKHRVEFTKNIDLTSYENEKRETHNPEGRALPPIVWDYYKNGCSVRLLNPQTFVPQIHTFLATLQEYFQCMVGANVYLTPENSQGFAPHYDDIEAFVIQIEGQKRWKLYNPRTENETLPRFSSGNFNPSEIGNPIADLTLKAGDVLYFPRGIIHQACTVKNSHSLHLTLSVYQKNSWGDLMEQIVPAALHKAIENDVEFRKGLPMNMSQYIGLVFSDQITPERTNAIKKIKSLFDKLFQYASVDDGVDAIQKKFQHDAMPPFIQNEEIANTVYGIKPVIEENGSVRIENPINSKTNIRLLRKNILRMVNENDKILIYFSSENSKEYHEFDPNFFEIDNNDAPIVEYLIRSYPSYVCVNELPGVTSERSVNVAADMWENGLIIIEA